MVIIDCLTDNNQRTISEVRNCFTKTGPKLGATGSVAMRFDHLAVLPFQGDSEERVLEAMLATDVNVVELECDAGRLTIFSPPEEFYKAKTALLQAFPDTEVEV